MCVREWQYVWCVRLMYGASHTALSSYILSTTDRMLRSIVCVCCLCSGRTAACESAQCASVFVRASLYFVGRTGGSRSYVHAQYAHTHAACRASSTLAASHHFSPTQIQLALPLCAPRSQRSSSGQPVADQFNRRNSIEDQPGHSTNTRLRGNNTKAALTQTQTQTQTKA